LEKALPLIRRRKEPVTQSLKQATCPTTFERKFIGGLHHAISDVNTVKLYRGVTSRGVFGIHDRASRVLDFFGKTQLVVGACGRATGGAGDKNLHFASALLAIYRLIEG
jgi:hypothetical protein